MPSFRSTTPGASRTLSKDWAFWVLVGIGAGLAGVFAFDIYVDWTHQGDPLWSTVLENSVPTLLALALPYSGWRLLRNASDFPYLPETAKWTVIGSAGTLFLASLVIGLHVLQGEIKPVVIVLQLTTIGAVGGLLVGYNLARVKESEHQAQENRDRLTNLLDGLPIPVVHGQAEGDRLRILRANRAFRETFSREADEVVGKNLNDLIVPEEKREEAAEIDQQAIDEGLVDTEVRRFATENLRDFRLRVAQALDAGASETYRVYVDVTEQKERERQLRLFKQVIEQANDAVVVTEAHPIDEPGPRIEYVNPAFEEMAGYSREEIEGKTPRMLQGPETDREVLDSLRNALERGESWSGETINYRKDGEPYHLQWSIAPVRNEDGEIERWMSIQRDVTEEKEREERLKTVNTRLQLALESSNTGTFDWDIETDEVIWDEISERLFGYAPGDFPGTYQGWADRVHPDDLPETERQIEHAIEHGKVYDVVFRVQPPDDEQRWVRARGSVDYDEAGNPIRMIGIHTDETTRKRREQKLREAQERMELVLKHTGSIVFEIDLETREVTRHGVFEDFFNASPEELPTWDVFAEHSAHPDDREKFFEFYRALEEGERESGTLEYRTSPETGEIRWIRDIVFVEEQGCHRWIRGLAQDVTEQKERTRELREAKEEAEEASRLKSAMLANMSHELRTPLTSVTGFSEMLTENLDGELEGFATRIHESSRRLQQTLESVLHLSKLEAGVHQLEREEVSFGEIAQEVVEMLGDHASDKSLTLTLEIPDSPVVGHWNEDALHRICRNLVENAIKFTPEGGQVDLRVSGNEHHAFLEVEDTGIGMDPDNVPELFRAFKQESEGLNREYEGSGLGLSIVKRLTEELEGDIEVDTEKGEATCFTVRLPLS